MTEAEILQRLDAGDERAAAAGLIELYGAEVFGYLCSLTKDQDEADEAFAQASEQLLSGIAKFRRESSLRTWFYAIARYAALHELKRAARRRADRISMLQDELAAAVRTATVEYRKTHVKDQIAELRASLSSDERDLLALRVDRQLSWEEIAQICCEPDAAAPADLKKAAQRYRKQFERTKEKLRELARAAGLI